MKASTAIAWVPTVLYRLIRIAEVAHCEFFDKLAVKVIWISPVLNPILYSFMSTKFVRQFKTAARSFLSQFGRRNIRLTIFLIKMFYRANNSILSP